MPDASQKRPSRRFSQEQHTMLMGCSKAKDVTEWNEWRKANPDTEILLAGANCYGARLQGVNLEGAQLRKANLEGAHLNKANLKGAVLIEANMRKANLWKANLENSRCSAADLEEAKLYKAHLEGADFTNAFVNGRTLIAVCSINSQTNFSAVGLAGARVQPGLRAGLETTIRRLTWDNWCSQRSRVVRWPVKLFWSISSYGSSTGRILATFLGLAVLFAAIYYFCPGLVANLHEQGNPPTPVTGWIVPLRAIYFSVVTMTTLGFGDIYANPESGAGHILLMVQVILGYVLLGALVTRLGVLFQSLGPAQRK